MVIPYKGGNSMECSESRILRPREYLEPLMTQYVEVERELKKTENQRRRRHLKTELDDLRMDLGWALMDCGRNEEGLAMYNSLSWKEHGEAKCNGICRALVGLGRHDEAARLLEAGLRRYPDSYMLWVAKGAFYTSLEDACESMKCFDRAILLAPKGSWEPLYNKVICLQKLGAFEEAVPILEALIEKYPGDPRFLSERGYCAMEMGYPQEALQYYRSAMESWPKDSDVYIGVNIYAGLCVAYTELGLKKAAMEIAMEGLKRFPDEDPMLYQNVGATFWELGWKEETREVLKKGIEKFPEDEELKKVFEDVDDDMDDPDNGVKPPLLGLMLLTALIYKKMRGRRRP
jgi:tetratricopeptide (TPR) repeat protein